jgi:hypothetical protein
MPVAYLERAYYDFASAMRYLAGLAAWYKNADPPQGQLFEDGGSIERRGVATDAAFVKHAQGFADALAEIERLPGLERWVCLACWRDGGRVVDAARRLGRRDAVIYAAFYAGTEEVLRRLTRQPGVKQEFSEWREGKRNQRLSEGV